jgi:hypothetical protein
MVYMLRLVRARFRWSRNRTLTVWDYDSKRIRLGPAPLPPRRRPGRRVRL